MKVDCMLSRAWRSLGESVSHTSVMSKQRQEEEAAACGRRRSMTHQSTPFPLAPPNGRSSPSAVGSLMRENPQVTSYNGFVRCMFSQNQRHVQTCDTENVSTQLRLTVREKANPHLYFSCSFQDLHSLKRKEKIWPKKLFWLNKGNIGNLLSEKYMIICPLEGRGGKVKVTDDCRRHASWVFDIHLCLL